jgi:hypothetical protein
MRKYRSRYSKGLLLVISILMLQGCASVEPWERGHLAKPQMSLDPYPMLNEMRGHNFGSREAAAGSSSNSGGGCGCY